MILDDINLISDQHQCDSTETETETETEKEVLRDSNEVAPDSKYKFKEVSKTIIFKPNLVKEDFDTFWQAYPVKKSKKKAYEAWKRQKPDLKAILKSLTEHKLTDQWIKGFIPYPQKFINERRYEDELQSEAVATKAPAWWTTHELTKEKADELGIVTDGLSTRQVREEIQRKINDGVAT